MTTSNQRAKGVFYEPATLHKFDVGDYRKVLFVLHDKRAKEGESLLSYYRRTYNHMIPDGVEFWSGTTPREISSRYRSVSRLSRCRGGGRIERRDLDRRFEDLNE